VIAVERPVTTVASTAVAGTVGVGGKGGDDVRSLAAVWGCRHTCAWMLPLLNLTRWSSSLAIMDAGAWSQAGSCQHES
jgi:hypothetical protein